MQIDERVDTSTHCIVPITVLSLACLYLYVYIGPDDPLYTPSGEWRRTAKRSNSVPGEAEW